MKRKCEALRQKMKDYELELQYKYEAQLSQNKDEVKTFIETTEAKKQESLTREARKLAKEVATTKQAFRDKLSRKCTKGSCASD
ncbi:hypothetical protein V4S28_02520 [Enterococcus cecorum]